MVTFCSITAFASTVIRGKTQGFHVRATSGKVDSISTLLVLEKYRRGLSSVRKDFFLTNSMSPGFLVLQPYQPGSAVASESVPFAWRSHQYGCKQTSRTQTEVVFTVCVALLSSFASICLIFSSRKQHYVLTEAAYVSHYQVIFSFSPGKSK